MSIFNTKDFRTKKTNSDLKKKSLCNDSGLSRGHNCNIQNKIHGTVTKENLKEKLISHIFH